jgi:predicted phage-related endonuclease
LASLDGATFDKSIIWEHKLWNAGLAAAITEVNEAQRAGDKNALHYLDPQYTAQLTQQMLVSGATKCLFMCSDGTADCMTFCWYTAADVEIDALIAGWKQFLSDLATYAPTAPTVRAVAAPVESLPAVQVSVSGQLAVISNLPEFGIALKAFIADIPKTPNTDNEFATCEAACKALKKAEDALEQAESYSLAQMTDVESMRRAVADLRALARATRLASEKMVAARKEQLRLEIVQAGRNALLEHVASLNTRLGKPYMPIIGADFALAIKGRRTIDSLHDAVNTTLANAKIEASATADKIQQNLKTLNEHKDFAFLFADVAALVLKAPDDLAAVVQNRIGQHQAKETARIEADRARIANEERIKAEATAQQRADAEIAAAREADRVAAAKELAARQAQDAITAAQATPVPAPVIAKPVPATVAVRPVVQPIHPAAPPTLTLGAMSNRLGFQLTAAFVASLGFEPAARVKASVLYHEHQFNDICQALIDHINSVCALQAA